MLTLCAVVVAFIAGYIFHDRKEPIWHDIRSLIRKYFPFLTHYNPQATANLTTLFESPSDDVSARSFVDDVPLTQHTVNAHFIVGALLRKQGDITQATQIHQKLASSAFLSVHHLSKAQLALCEDYAHAGMFDRAEAIYKSLIASDSTDTALKITCLNHLKKLYELMQDWPQAIVTADTLSKIDSEQRELYRRFQAHYCCEQAVQYIETQQNTSAKVARGFVKKAKEYAPNHPRVGSLEAFLDSVFDVPSEQRLDATLPSGIAQSSVATDKYLSRVFKTLLARDANTTVPAVLAALNGLSDNTFHSPVILSHKLALYIDCPSLQYDQGFIFNLLENITDFVHSDQSFKALRPLVKSLFDAGLKNNTDARHALIAYMHALLIKSAVFECTSCGYSQKESDWFCPACKSWDSFEHSLT